LGTVRRRKLRGNSAKLMWNTTDKMEVVVDFALGMNSFAVFYAVSAVQYNTINVFSLLALLV